MAKRIHISQAEARRLRRELSSLRQKLDLISSSYSASYPGTNVGTINADQVLGAQFRTAARLGFNLIVRHQVGDTFVVFATPATERA